MLAVTALICVGLSQGSAWCEEPWRVEFDAACAQTGVAMSLSVEELNLLMQRTAALEKVIETQDGSVRKVFLKRLQMCRNLYAYVLEYKTKDQPAK